MANVLIVVGNPTAGQRDGVLVSQNTGMAPIQSPTPLQIYTDAEGQAVKSAIRTINGTARPGPCAIELVGTSADKWALAPDDNGEPGTWGAWGAPLVVEDLIALNTVFWIKPRVISTETMPFGLLEWNDTSVKLRTPDDVIAAAPVNAAPYFDSAVQIISRNEAGFTIQASYTDPDNDAVTAKRIVKTNSTTPTQGDWDAAPAYTEPSQVVSGLLADTQYFVWVQVKDVHGNTTTAGPISTSTLAPGENQAPQFTTAPRIKAGSVTGSGYTIEMAYSDAESDPITVKLSVNGGAYNTVNPVLNQATQLRELVFTNKEPGTAEELRVRLEDQWNIGAEGTTSEPFTVTTTMLWTFTHQAGTAPDANYFTPKTHGGGTVVTDGAGHMKIQSVVADDLAALTWKNPVARNADRTFIMRAKTSGSVSNLMMFALLAQPTTAPNRDLGPNNNKVLSLDIVSSGLRLRRINAAGTHEFFDPATGMWNTASATIPITAGEYITSQLQFSATQGVRITLTNSTGSVIASTAWMGWATLLQVTDPQWLTMGDTYSGTGLELGFGILLVDSYEVY